MIEYTDNENNEKKHRDNEYGFGASKAQHFIEHIREASGKPDWQDNQEKFAEEAQLAVCDELNCPVCANNCRLMTQMHWDMNRMLEGHDVKYPNSYKLAEQTYNLYKRKGYIK